MTANVSSVKTAEVVPVTTYSASVTDRNRNLPVRVTEEEEVCQACGAPLCERCMMCTAKVCTCEEDYIELDSVID
jgi:hypothetical protein